MSVDTDRRLVAQLIRAIPPDSESQVPIDQLGAVTRDGAVLVALLEAWGVLRTTVDPATGIRSVKADTPTASHFLRSLAEYVENGQAILDNWSREGTVEAPYEEAAVLSGPQFLYFMERRRLARSPGAAALRKVQVAQVVIKRAGRLRGPEYLVIHDAAARQFQLPGGHARSGDRDSLDVATRELQEELPGFVFDSRSDRLVSLGTVDVTSVSRTYGVATRYAIAFFHLQSRRTSLWAGPAGRWISEDDLLSDPARVEQLTLNVVGLRRLNDTLAGGMAGLGSSLPESRGGELADLSRRKPLEFWGFVFGAVGLLVSVVFFLAER
jgi:hypothetical protein